MLPVHPKRNHEEQFDIYRIEQQSKHLLNTLFSKGNELS